MKRRFVILFLCIGVVSGCAMINMAAQSIAQYLPYVRDKYSTDTYNTNDSYKSIFEGKDVPMDMH